MGISAWQIVIVLLIVVLLFGTKKLRTLGSDMGEAVKGFKKGIAQEEEADETLKIQHPSQATEAEINQQKVASN